MRLPSPPLRAAVRHESALHRAQRDALCTGAICLLLFVIYRLHALLKEVNQLAATKEALAKQAEGAAAAYKAACEERDVALSGAEGKAADREKAREAETAKSQSEAEDELERARQTISTLRERNAALLAAVGAPTTTVAGLRAMVAQGAEPFYQETRNGESVMMRAGAAGRSHAACASAAASAALVGSSHAVLLDARRARRGCRLQRRHVPL